MIKCEFAEQSATSSLICSKKPTNKRCGYQRWCPTSSCWENTWSIHDCEIRNEALKEMDKKDIKLAKPKLEKPAKEDTQVDEKVVEQVPVNGVTEIKEEIEFEKPVEKKKEQKIVKTKTVKCKKLFIRKNKVYFNFENHSLSFDSAGIDNNAKLVNVTFEGKLGKPNFKIVSVKNAI